MGTTNRAEELAKEYSLKMNGINFDNLFPNTDETIGEIGIKDFIAGYNSSQSEIDELTKEVERLRKERELFEKRCVNLSKSTDEILEYLIPFVDNYLDDNDINRIIKWHNDNSNRH